MIQNIPNICIYTRYLSREQLKHLHRQLKRVSELDAAEVIDMFTLMCNSHLPMACNVACAFARQCQHGILKIVRTDTMDAEMHSRLLNRFTVLDAEGASITSPTLNARETLMFFQPWFRLQACETLPAGKAEVVAATAAVVVQTGRAMFIPPAVSAEVWTAEQGPKEDAIRNIVNTILAARIHGMTEVQLNGMIATFASVWPPGTDARILDMVHQAEAAEVTQLVEEELHVPLPTVTLADKVHRAMSAVRGDDLPLLGRPTVNGISTYCNNCAKAVEAQERFTFTFPLAEYAAALQAQNELSEEIGFIVRNDPAKRAFVSWTFHNTCF